MSRLYIRVMTNFYTHRKTARLRTLIGDSAFWIPPRLWAYAAENQPDGNLSGYNPEELAMLIGCSSNAQAMLQALKDSGFVDSNGFIHDWNDHNRYHNAFSARAKTAAEARWGKEKSPTPPKDREGQRTVDSGASNAYASPKHCLSIKFKIPSLDEVKLLAAKSGLSDFEAEKFFNYYTSNGWRVGRNPMKSIGHAMANWRLNVKQDSFPSTVSGDATWDARTPEEIEQQRKLGFA